VSILPQYFTVNRKSPAGTVSPFTLNPALSTYNIEFMTLQARHQDFIIGVAENHKGRPNFFNTVLDVCSNLWAENVIGGTDFKWEDWAPLSPH